MKNQKIFLVCGFHVNCNHSWRGDRNDRTGFGMDLKIIKGVLDILDEANSRGLDARGTWDFDNYWSLENVLPRFAPDVLEGIVRRVTDGPDEAILGCWNNGDVAASTVEEFRENLRRTISNPQGSGIKDVFGTYTPAIRTQETMFTHGSIEMYLEQGVEAIALYYSAVPFDAIRNFVPRLSPNEMYNPMWLKSTASDALMLMIPMYNQGDIVTKGSLRRWVLEIRIQQEKGAIPGNALIYINMDADAEVWTGIGLPKVFQKLPNVRGLPEFIELASDLEYLEFGTLGDYIRDNPPVGELTVRQDLADGSYTGFNSWAEKAVNQELWRLSERARWRERIADFLSLRIGADPDARRDVEKLLFSPGDSCFDSKIKLLSTTHFGMNSPAVHPERLRVAFHLARTAYDKSDAAAMIALEKSNTVPRQPAVGDALFGFTVVNQPKYRGEARVEPGTRSLIRVPFELDNPAPVEKLALVDRTGLGNNVPFDIDAEPDERGNIEKGTLYVLHTATEAANCEYILKATGGGAAGPGALAAKDSIGNGLISLKLDARGRIVSLVADGTEVSEGQLLTLGATYRVDSQRKHFTPRAYLVTEHGVGPMGRLAKISLSSRTVLFIKGKNYPIEADYDLFVFSGLPYLFLDADVRFPLTPAETGDISAVSRIEDRFDTNWFEVMPAELKPAIFSLPGKFLRVWKHNFKNVTNYYEYDYGKIDRANRNVDSCNNQVTDGWVAVSNTEKGLLIGFDSRVNSTPACCPMRLREHDSVQRVAVNPFGTYFGKQLSHLNKGFNFAAEFTRIIGSQHRPTAPSFNGKKVAFSMMLAPYAGDAPPEQAQRDADSFSMPPAAVRVDKNGPALLNDVSSQEELDALIKKYNLDACEGWTYADFLTECNKDLKTGVPEEDQSTPIGTFVKLIVEGIKMRP